MRFLQEHFAYLYSDTDGNPVYAGCTYNLKKRKSEHKLASWWWTSELQVTFTAYPNYGAAMDAEAILINDLRPSGNQVIPADPRVVGFWLGGDPSMRLHSIGLSAS